MPRSPSSARSSSRSSQLDRGGQGRGRRQLRPTARAWLRQLEEWREQFPFRYEKARRRAEAADGDRGAARPRRRRATRTSIWTTGVGQHQMWAMQYIQCEQAAHVHHLGRARDDGLRHPGGDRREGRAAGRDGRLHRRRRLLPDDVPGARDRGARAAADRRRDHQQRLARDGAPVAGDVLRRALRADASHARRSRTTRSSPRRTAAPASRSRPRTSSRRRSTAAFAAGRSAVVDVRCDAEEKCFPMIPAGRRARSTCIEAPRHERGAGFAGAGADDDAHDLGPAGEQARVRWRASRSSSRAAATTSRASRSGRPSGPTSRG